MFTANHLRRLLIVTTMFVACQALAGVERIYVLKEIDDDHVIVVTKAGEKLLLEKWTMRFSPLLFEGKYFTADVSPMWVTIYFEGRDPIKWSVKESLGYVTPSPQTPRSSGRAPSSAAPNPRSQQQLQCYDATIREPTPFLGNGGEIFILDDGSVWKEVSYQYLYLYEYYPSVVVCPSQGKMILGGHVFEIVPAR